MSAMAEGIRTKWQIVDHPHARNSGNRKVVHGLRSYFNKRVYPMSYSSVTVCDPENHTTRLLLEMLQEFLWTIKYVEQKMGRLDFLGAVECRYRFVATRDFRDDFAMDLPCVIVRTHTGRA